MQVNVPCDEDILDMENVVSNERYLTDSKLTDKRFMSIFVSVYLHMRMKRRMWKERSVEEKIKRKKRYDAMKTPGSLRLKPDKVVRSRKGTASSLQVKKHETIPNVKRHNSRLVASQMSASISQYTTRLTTLLKMMNPNPTTRKKKSLVKSIFENPSFTLKVIKRNQDKKTMSPNTTHNLLAVLLVIVKCSRVLAKSIEKRFLEKQKKRSTLSKSWKTRHCEVLMKNRQAQQVYGEYMGEIGRMLREQRHSNKMPLKAKANYVSMKEIADMCKVVRAEARSYIDEKKKNAQGVIVVNDKPATQVKKMRMMANRLLLFSSLCHFPPKRADYGNVKLWYTRRALARLRDQVSLVRGDAVKKVISGRVQSIRNVCNLNEVKNKIDLSRNNMMLIDTDAKNTFIAFKVYKTAQHHQTLKEITPLQMHRDLWTSLTLWPRSHMFVQQTGGTESEKPYLKNNSFTQFFIRTFENVFKRRVGCSMLRHIFITEKVDPNKVSLSKQKQIAARMLHSHKEQMQYRWTNVAPSRQR